MLFPGKMESEVDHAEDVEENGVEKDAAQVLDSVHAGVAELIEVPVDALRLSEVEGFLGELVKGDDVEVGDVQQHFKEVLSIGRHRVTDQGKMHNDL